MANLTRDDYDISPVFARFGELDPHTTLPHLLSSDPARSTNQETIDLLAKDILPSIISGSGQSWKVQSNTLDDMLNLVEVSLISQDDQNRVIQILIENIRSSVINLDVEDDDEQLQTRRSFEIKEQVMSAMSQAIEEDSGQPGSLNVVVINEQELLSAESKEEYVKNKLKILSRTRQEGIVRESRGRRVRR